MKDAHAMVVSPDTLFSPRLLWHAWLDVEVALAQAQAELGMIPDWAAKGIAAAPGPPLRAVNHLEAHGLTAALTGGAVFSPSNISTK